MDAGTRRDLLGLTYEGMVELVTSLGGRPVHARRLFAGIHRQGVVDPMELQGDIGRALARALASGWEVALPEVVGSAASTDGTTRYLLRLRDGQLVESVVIPDGSRTTLCISSQVGCAMGCAFCRTGTMGLRRNLTAGEITGQVVLMRGLLGDRGLTNVVFMGMGEPFANYGPVRDAVAILIHDLGGHIPPKRITVSTAGIPSGIRRLGRDFSGRVSLAVSLTGTTDVQRDRLMPINRRHPIAEVLAACRAYPLPKARVIAFEYVLIAGETDRDEDADRLVALLDGLPSKVNLIPLNPFPGSALESPTPEAVDRFFRRLNSEGLRATIRHPRGREVAAACGLLAADPGVG